MVSQLELMKEVEGESNESLCVFDDVRRIIGVPFYLGRYGGEKVRARFRPTKGVDIYADSNSRGVYLFDAFFTDEEDFNLHHKAFVDADRLGFITNLDGPLEFSTSFASYNGRVVGHLPFKSFLVYALINVIWGDKIHNLAKRF